MGGAIIENIAWESSGTLVCPWVDAEMISGRLRYAVYRADEMNPIFSENPLVLSFPGCPDDENALTYLANEPTARGADFFKLPIGVRIECCDQIREVFVPAREHIDGFQATMRVLRGSYSDKNPLSIEFMNHIHRICLAGFPVTLPECGGYSGSPGGIVMIGPTGSGKTSLCNRIGTYVGDGGVLHTMLGGLPCRWPQIPIVRVSVAGRTTVKQLALAIAAKVDDICQPRITFASQLGQSSQHVTKTAAMLTSNLVGLLILEDVQLWGRVDKRLRLNMMDFLVGVLEEGRTPIMCVGTMLLLNVLEAHISQAEKLMTLGQIPLPPILDQNDMDNICRKLWQWRITEGDPEPPDWFSREVGVYTAGLRRYIRKYLGALFSSMAQDGIRVPNCKYMRGVAESCMGPFMDAVKIINRAYSGRRVDRNSLVKYEEYINSIDYRARVSERSLEITRRLNLRKNGRA